MYRLLTAEGGVREPRRQLRHAEYKRPELLATAPNQVWSWDVTWLRGPTKGQVLLPVRPARHLQPLRRRWDPGELGEHVDESGVAHEVAALTGEQGDRHEDVALAGARLAGHAPASRRRGISSDHPNQVSRPRDAALCNCNGVTVFLQWSGSPAERTDGD